jgi:hypothetical protein
MQRFLKWVSTAAGAVLSVLGFAGAACTVCAPVCGAVCIAGPLAAILGGTGALFLHRYSALFIALGLPLIALGIWLFVRAAMANRRRDAGRTSSGHEPQQA